AVDGWELVVNNLGTIPRVALGLGSGAGLGAAHLAAAHSSVMIKDKSALFVAGPPVVERLGQKLTKNELGGGEIQLKAGAGRHPRHPRGARVPLAPPSCAVAERPSPAAGTANRRDRWARALAFGGDPPRRPKAVQDAGDRRGG